jgi:hypothetical protein
VSGKRNSGPRLGRVHDRERGAAGGAKQGPRRAHGKRSEEHRRVARVGRDSFVCFVFAVAIEERKF